MSTLALDAPELVSAATVAAICNKEPRTVRMRMADVEPARTDERGTKWWRIDQLPADYQLRIEQAKIIKGFARAEDIVNWAGRAAAEFHWTIDQLTDDEQARWPIRKLALEEYYRCIDAGLTNERAEARACEVWKFKMGTTVEPRTIRNWRVPVDKCGGPEHAPDEAYSIWRRGKKAGAIPHATQLYFNSLLADNARKFIPAYRELMLQLARWREGSQDDAIPGYDAPPPNANGKNHPYRWTRYYLINKKRRPSPRVMTLARIGKHAADEITAIVSNKRTGTKVGQFYFFDDQVYDEKVNLIGINEQDTRPLGLDCLDFTSACLCKQMFIPTVWNTEEKCRETIKGWHTNWFVCDVLTEIGYRRDAVGTTLIPESGTMKIDEKFAERIALVTDDKVTVRELHPDNPTAFSGVFEGPGAGNPRVKAPLESARNRQRNDMANRLVFPAQTLHDRNEPEELTGRDRYNNWLIKYVPETLRPLFRFPVNEFSRFVECCVEYTERINKDFEHRLRDWLDCGFTTREWRMRDDPEGKWRSLEEFDELDPVDRLMVENALRANPERVRGRKLSRREVFDAGRGDLVKVPAWDIPRLMGPEFAVVRKVSQCGTFIRFVDEKLDPYKKEFVFLARMQDREEHRVDLTPGASYRTYLNPLRPDRLIVCQMNGGFLGICHAINGTEWQEHEKRMEDIALQRGLGAAAKKDLEILGQRRTRELHSIKMQNAGAAAPNPTARKQQQKAAAKGLAKLYTDDA